MLAHRGAGSWAPSPEHARDCDSLLLAAGELGRVFVCMTHHVDFAQSILSQAPGDVGRLLSDYCGRERNVSQHGEMRKQVEVLEDHAYPAPNLPHSSSISRKGDAVDSDNAFGVNLDAVDTPKQR